MMRGKRRHTRSRREKQNRHEQSMHIIIGGSSNRARQQPTHNTSLDNRHSANGSNMLQTRSATRKTARHTCKLALFGDHVTRQAERGLIVGCNDTVVHSQTSTATHPIQQHGQVVEEAEQTSGVRHVCKGWDLQKGRSTGCSALVFLLPFSALGCVNLHTVNLNIRLQRGQLEQHGTACTVYAFFTKFLGVV